MFWLFLQILSLFYVFICDVRAQSCYVAHICGISEWQAWGPCSEICGGGKRRRAKRICCDPSIRPFTLDGCLINCNFTRDWFVANLVESELCNNICFHGSFNTFDNDCKCLPGFSGSCCKKVVPITSAPKSVAPITSAPKSVAPTTSAPKSTTNDRSAIGGKTVYALNQKLNCSTNLCVHGTCLSTNLRDMCVCDPGYEGRNCQIDKNECQQNPCRYGICVDKVNDFNCHCSVLFKGKRCSKLTTLAIAFLSIASLALLCTCCCCFWCLASLYREKKEKKRKPQDKKSKVLPLVPKPIARPEPNVWF